MINLGNQIEPALGRRKKKKKGKSSGGSSSKGGGGGSAGDGVSNKAWRAPQRNLLQEGRDALALMDEAYPRLLANEQKYGPEFAKSEVATARTRSEAESRAVTESGGRMRQAMLETSPEIAASTKAQLDRLGELGPSETENLLVQQTRDDLALGGRLNADEARTSDQATRAALSARGLATGTRAAIMEVMNRTDASTARLRGRQAAAAGVEGMVAQRKAGDATIANNIGNSLEGFWDPQQRMFGKGGSQVTGQVSGPSSYAPFLGAAGSVGSDNAKLRGEFQLERNKNVWDREAFWTQREDSLNIFDQQLQFAQSEGAKNRRAQLWGSAIGVVGSIVGGFM